VTQNIHGTCLKSGMGTTLSTLLLALSLSLGGAAGARATTFVLYDGALGGLPSEQGMFFLGPGITPTATGGVTNLDTSSADVWQAGFGALSPVALDATLGYTLEFSAEILAESHSSNVRAGFSVIVVGADPTASIEISFQDGQVFAQNDDPLFGSPSANANVAFNPVGMGFVNYSLTVLGNSYSLLANGAAVLGGSLRDYTEFNGFPDPYEAPSSIFLGDDSTSARANVNLSRVALVTPSEVPPPAAAWLFISALGGLVVAKRRQLKA
jgi:hypothetical protein